MEKRFSHSGIVVDRGNGFGSIARELGHGRRQQRQHGLEFRGLDLRRHAAVVHGHGRPDGLDQLGVDVDDVLVRGRPQPGVGAVPARLRPVGLVFVGDDSLAVGPVAGTAYVRSPRRRQRRQRRFGSLPGVQRRYRAPVPLDHGSKRRHVLAVGGGGAGSAGGSAGYAGMVRITWN